jgi:hypothetical protein
MSEDTKALIKKMRDRRTHYYDGPLFDQAANVIESLSAKLAECEHRLSDANIGLECQIARAEAAEARVKELGGLLQEIKSLVCGEKIPSWQDHYSTTRTRGRIADLIDATLSPAPKEPSHDK